MAATSPTGEVCACDFPGTLDRSQPTISHHLRQLVTAGILRREQRANGLVLWYTQRHGRHHAALGEGADA
ncbi:MAG: ArsR family transcriptional regulator [Ilumatobacteraceae bacterium]